MATQDTRYLCVYTQESADRVLADNHPAKQEIPTFGFMNSLESDVNTGMFQQIEFRSALGRPTGSTNRKAEIRLTPKTCTAVSDGEATCATTTDEASEDITDTVNVSQYKHRKVTIDKVTVQDLCEGNVSEVMGKKILDMAGDLIRAKNTYLATQFETLTGAYANGDDSSAGSGTERALNLFGTDATPQAMGMFKLRNEYNQKGYHNQPIITVGGVPFSAWVYAQPVFNGDNDGKDTLRLPSNVYPFVDYEVDTIAQAAASDALFRAWSYIPGHVQSLKWLKYGEGSPLRRTDSSEGVKDTITVMGHTFDLLISDPFCNDDATVTLGWGYDLWAIDSNYITSACGGQFSLLSHQLAGAALTYANDIIG